jgi:hypothetical protein
LEIKYLAKSSSCGAAAHILFSNVLIANNEIKSKKMFAKESSKNTATINTINYACNIN